MIQGKGLGLRREFLLEAAKGPQPLVDFYELAPENWIGVGGRRLKALEKIASETDFIAHGLSLSIGSLAPLDTDFLVRLRDFLDTFEVKLYSDHLSYASDSGQLYDLMPIPFSEEAIKHVAERVRIAQDILKRPIALENVSYYADVGFGMSELDFIQGVLSEADCRLLLDVNNIYVNSVNHGYDAKAFLKALPTERIDYIHIAGHEQVAPDLVIDTHGSPVIEPVFELLEEAYKIHGNIPTLLERDNDVPPLGELIEELAVIGHIRQERGFQ